MKTRSSPEFGLLFRAGRWLGLMGALALLSVPAIAGHYTNDFNSASSTNLLDFGGTIWDGVANGGGTANWRRGGGAGPMGSTVPNAVPPPGVSGDGFVQLNFANAFCADPPVWASFPTGGILFDDFDSGLVVAGFTFECDIRAGNGTASPADGFSISYMRNSDCILSALAQGDTLAQMNSSVSFHGGQFADFGNAAQGNISLPNFGTTTGLGIGFNLYASKDFVYPPQTGTVNGTNWYARCTEAPGVPTHIYPGLLVFVDSVLVQNVVMTNGTSRFNWVPATCCDPYSLETGPTDGSGNYQGNGSGPFPYGIGSGTGCDSTSLYWAHLKVDMSTNGVLNLWYKGNQLITNLATGYFPSPGRLLMAARGGAKCANIEVDNIQITTIPAAKLLIGNAQATPIGISVQVSDSGSIIADTSLSSIQLQVNGTTRTPTAVSKSGPITTINWWDAASPFPAGSTQQLSLTIHDTHGNPSSATLPAVVPAYTPIPSATAVGSVDTGQPGFNVKVHQIIKPDQSSDYLPLYYLPVSLEPSIRRAEEQLAGLLGANDASLSTYAETNVINYSCRYSQHYGYFSSFTDTNDGTHYQEAPMPGVGQDDINSSTVNDFALEITTYIQFPEAGLYRMTFNSQDGCRLTAGNPAADNFNSLLLGQYDGARTDGDTSGLLYIPAAGFYPFRSVYYHGVGEAACEWDLQELAPTPGPLWLLNDSTVASAPKTYRASSAAYPAAV